MSALPTVAFAGATGSLGPAIVKEVLVAGYSVTLLTRQGSTSARSLPDHPNQKVKEVDYESQESLVSALTGIQVLVCTFGHTAIHLQKPLIDASITAGVSRFVASEFGSDSLNPQSAKLPVYKPKKEIEHYLRTKAAEHPQLTWTIFLNNAFFDWGLSVGFLVNIKEHTARIIDEGDNPFSTTRLSTVGRGIVAVLKNLDSTANKPVYVHDAVVTQNQIINIIKKIDGQEWKLTYKTSEENKKEADDSVSKGDFGSAMIPMLFAAIFSPGFGGDFRASGKVMNQELGLKELDENEVEDIVRAIVAGQTDV